MIIQCIIDMPLFGNSQVKKFNKLPIDAQQNIYKLLNDERDAINKPIPDLLTKEDICKNIINQKQDRNYEEHMYFLKINGTNIIKKKLLDFSTKNFYFYVHKYLNLETYANIVFGGLGVFDYICHDKFSAIDIYINHNNLKDAKLLIHKIINNLSKHENYFIEISKNSICVNINYDTTFIIHTTIFKQIGKVAYITGYGALQLIIHDGIFFATKLANYSIVNNVCPYNQKYINSIWQLIERRFNIMFPFIDIKKIKKKKVFKIGHISYNCGNYTCKLINPYKFITIFDYALGFNYEVNKKFFIRNLFKGKNNFCYCNGFIEKIFYNIKSIMSMADEVPYNCLTKLEKYYDSQTIINIIKDKYDDKYDIKKYFTEKIMIYEKKFRTELINIKLEFLKEDCIQDDFEESYIKKQYGDLFNYELYKLFRDAYDVYKKEHYGLAELMS